MKVIRVSHYDVRSIGHGGYHRAYQVQHDLESAVGAENVIRFDDPWIYYPSPPKNWLAAAWQTQQKKFARYTENPANIVTRTEFSVRQFSFPRLLAAYEQLASTIDQPTICVIEHPGFSNIITINNRYGIATISCTQNLEALDLSFSENTHRSGMYSKFIDLANELGVFTQCAERLFISKVETGLVSGLGVPALYYPYLPAGDIRDRLDGVRHERLKGNIELGLFLIMGTAGHDTTRASFEWFVQNAQAHGLPTGTKVVVVGLGTDKLLPPGVAIPGLEFKGWVEQNELDQLLATVQGVLIPQQHGFGALTRLPELAYAGVPVVTSKHATLAINMPPNVSDVDDVWEAWYAGINQLKDNNTNCCHKDYLAWESKQSRTLEAVVKKALGLAIPSTADPVFGLMNTSPSNAVSSIHTEENLMTDTSVEQDDEVANLRKRIARLEAEKQNGLSDYVLARRTLIEVSNSRAYRLLKRLGRWKWLENVILQLPARQ
jgi:hypothetical protein